MPLLALLRSFFRSDYGISLVIALSWQGVFTAVGAVLGGGSNILSHTVHWDAGWYLHIISSAYGSDGSPAAPVFYPLFPLLVGSLSFVTFGLIGNVPAALIINTAALWLALVALLRILQHFFVSRNARMAAMMLFLTFPSAFFMHAFYGEAVFIAIGFWAYLFALRQKWWAACILLAILTASRLPSLLFVALCGLEYLRAHDWSIKQAFTRNLAWFLLTPLGFLAYGTYLHFVRGDFLAMFHAYHATEDWTYQVFSPNIFLTLAGTVKSIGDALLSHQFTYEIFVNQLLPLLAVAGLAASSIYCIIRLRSKGIPLTVFGFLAIIMFTLNSNVVSVHRYVLPCIVLYVALALWWRPGKRQFIAYTFIFISLVLQLYLYVKFISGAFAG